VIKDEGLKVESIRIPAEPIVPFILTPSLYFSYKPVGIVKQWLLKFLTFINGREIKKSGIDFSYFMGVMFSGNVTEDKIKKLLPRYLKIAKKHGKDIEIAFHPGYIKNGENLIEGYKTGFKKFYFSPLRYKEYETLINFKL
jgi:hypothetical protein